MGVSAEGPLLCPWMLLLVPGNVREGEAALEKLEWMERSQCEMLQSWKMCLAVTWMVPC